MSVFIRRGDGRGMRNCPETAPDRGWSGAERKRRQWPRRLFFARRSCGRMARTNPCCESFMPPKFIDVTLPVSAHLADTIGVTEPALYRHFRNKAEIVKA